MPVSYDELHEYLMILGFKLIRIGICEKHCLIAYVYIGKFSYNECA